ncbi:hypothetical protein ACRE_070890 [Hapsidospora chrysogenum ATCC 11550]|uniref:Rhodopsin domain-containing protein n=1 Tax=Hapsidospora chrysogenum (strain ATCC 11550 / CBS 779.69 / DSM 880 / IAM 14645 / JCM 23072 / IMI 49137) TaxID=857340 RepID=A0A086SYI7_HAPC1|nr:hypothetical protein ACRE_070890 [Hapsidospora chrysogenum ATCC 11550]
MEGPAQAPLSEAYRAESQADLLYALFALPIPLELLSTLFRLWVKARKTTSRRVAADDYLMIFATFVSIAVCVIALAYDSEPRLTPRQGPSNGLGRHIETVSAESLASFRKADYVFSHFYNLGIATTKLSVLALYHGIFGGNPLFRTLIIATSTFILAWILVMELVLAAGCRPVQVWWGAAQGPCVDKIAFTYFTNTTNLAADLWIFSMPIPTIMRLQALRDRRASLFFLFSVGLGTCLLSAARLGFVFAVGTGDITWWGGPLAILSCWETCGGVLCANLPIVYKTTIQFLVDLRTRILGSSAFTTTKPRTTSDAASGAAAASSSSAAAATRSTTTQQSRPSGCPYHDWHRLHHTNSSGGGGRDGHDDGTDDEPLVFANMSSADGTEMDEFGMEGGDCRAERLYDHRRGGGGDTT